MTGRALRVVLLGACFTAAAGIATAQERGTDVPEVGDTGVEWERDLHAVVPVGHWNVSEDVYVGATRVIDETTGDPIAGAQLLRYTEMTGPDATLLGATTTDALGYAALPLHDWREDCHWLVLADGYAPEEGYGVAPDAEIGLTPGRSFTFDVVDGMGRPVAGARVEAFDGCGHAPTARATTTDTNGRFTLDDIQYGTILWIAHATVAPDYTQPAYHTRLGAHRQIVVRQGVVVEGVVTDPAGVPLARVEVRAAGLDRGPAVLTGADGRYRLDGARPGEMLSFAHPLSAAPLWIDDDAWMPGVPLRIALTPWGRAEESGAAFTGVSVHVRDAAGRPVPRIDVALCRHADGRVVTELTSGEDPDDDEPPTGVAAFELPPGKWEVVNPDPFSSHALGAPQFDVGTESLTVHAVAVERPRLRSILPDGWYWGRVSQGATIAIAVPGHEISTTYDRDEPDWTPHVPADCPAVLRIEDRGRTWFYELGPVVPHPDAPGTTMRTASPAVTLPDRILLPRTDARGVELLHAGRACDIEEHRKPVPAITTRAYGKLVLRLDLGDGRLEDYDVEIEPDDSWRRVPREYVLDPAAARAVPNAELRVTLADRLPERVELEIAGAGVVVHDLSAHLSAPGSTTLRARGDVVVRARREGHATLRILATAPGEIALAWGDAAIELDIVEEDGDPFETLILVDGETIAGPDGDLTTTGQVRVAGLTVGAHTIAVIPTDPELVGREFRVDLAAGETRRKRILLRVAD